MGGKVGASPSSGTNASSTCSVPVGGLGVKPEGSQARGHPRPQGHAQRGNATAVHDNETMADMFSMTTNSSDLLTNNTHVPFYHMQMVFVLLFYFCTLYFKTLWI